MLTAFDVTLFLAILLAMLASKQPKRAAMALAVIAFLVMVGADSWIHGNAKYEAIIRIEFLLTAIYAIGARLLIMRSNALFMDVMALMFAFSCFWTTLYLYTDGISFPLYQQGWHAIGITHVAIMLGFSDGCGSLVDYWRSGFNSRLHNRRY